MEADLDKGLEFYIGSFPESLYQVDNEFKKEYVERVIQGRNRITESTALICGLARDVEKTLPYNIARIRRLGNMFKHFWVYIFENDSVDNTKQILSNWSTEDPNVIIYCNNYDKIRHEQDMSRNRMTDMAFYRNHCLSLIKSASFDYNIIVDMDIEGGFSYEGVCNSIGYDNWDFMGANGIQYRIRNEKYERLHFDSFAFRQIGSDGPHDGTEVNRMWFDKGQPPILVESCFGGLGIYKRYAITTDLTYSDEDCEHVTIHNRMRQNGFDKIYMNPSQIVVYTKTPYVI